MGEGGVEGVSADDLVEVRGGDGAGVDEGVDAVVDELRAFEAHHGGGAGGWALRGGEGGEEEEGGEGVTHDGWVVERRK